MQVTINNSTGWLLISGVWIGWRELDVVYPRELFGDPPLPDGLFVVTVCCGDDCVWELFGENDDMLDAGDDGIVCISPLWLSSESSLESEDGGVGGKPNPIV